jgi:hypothetical protein
VFVERVPEVLLEDLPEVFLAGCQVPSPTSVGFENPVDPLVEERDELLEHPGVPLLGREGEAVHPVVIRRDGGTNLEELRPIVGESAVLLEDVFAVDQPAAVPDVGKGPDLVLVPHRLEPGVPVDVVELFDTVRHRLDEFGGDVVTAVVRRRLGDIGGPGVAAHQELLFDVVVPHVGELDINVGVVPDELLELRGVRVPRVGPDGD